MAVAKPSIKKKSSTTSTTRSGSSGSGSSGGSSSSSKGYYDANTDYSKELQRTDLTSEQRSQLETERQNKINDMYGGVEPNMIGSDKTYSQTVGSSGTGSGGSSGNSAYGVPVISPGTQTPSGGVQWSQKNAMPDMSRRTDLAGQYATSGGFTVFYDNNGYATQALKGKADYTPSQGTSSQTDQNFLTGDEQKAIEALRSQAQSGAITWDQANQQANDIRSKYGYSVDKNGNVTDLLAKAKVDARREAWGLSGQTLTPEQQALLQQVYPNGYQVPGSGSNPAAAQSGQNVVNDANPNRGVDIATGTGQTNSYTGGMRDYLDQWLSAAQQQQSNAIDFGTSQSINELVRAQQDAEAQYQEQRNQIAIDEAKAKDNHALYAEARGDKGGIGAAQYDTIMNTAAQNRLQVNSAQTKLATDTARQIADLRARGEYEKADALLSLSQQYLSQLMSLEQWSAEYNLSVAQFNASLQQWEKEYELSVADMMGSYNGQPTMSAKQFAFNQQQYQDELASAQESKLASAGEILLAAGILPSASQLSAMGLTEDQAQSYITAQKVAAAAAAAKRSSSGKGTTGSNSGGADYDSLFQDAYNSGNPQSYISNNYKKYGFRSSTGLYNDYKAAAETPVKSGLEMNPDHYRAFTASIDAQLRFGKENAAIGNINSRWNEMSAAQQEGIQELLRKYGYSYSPGE